ncbi:MAG: hypothetical protein ACUVRY_04890 [Thermoanaerobaculaceae bacterium]
MLDGAYQDHGFALLFQSPHLLRHALEIGPKAREKLRLTHVPGITIDQRFTTGTW